MGGKRLYREYDDDGNLIKLECSKCGEIKSVDNFNKCKTCKDGYRYECKLCKKEYSHQRYQENKEKELERSHQYYQDNKEKKLEYSRQYYQENKEKILEYRRQYIENNKEYQRQYIEKNKEKLLKYKRQYYQENKEKLVDYSHQYIENKLYKELSKIYENVTKNLYPNNDIQYGIIYGVHCINTDRWYIGQTRKTFNLRYRNNFFKCKFNELPIDNPKLQLLHEDIEKYGKENFEIFEVIDVAFSEKELDEKECYYIDLYKAYDVGYNSNRGNIFKHEKSKRKDVI